MAIVGNVFGLSDAYKKQVQNTIDNNLDNWAEIPEYGYFVGGRNNPESSSPFTVHSALTRIDFSTDIDAFSPLTYKTVSPISRYFVVASQTPSYGFYSGGNEPGSTPEYSCNIERLDYSNETITDIQVDYIKGTTRSAICQNDSYAFNAGGSQPGGIADIYKFDFSNYTVTAPGNNLPANRYAASGTQSNTYGYYSGGKDSSHYSNILKLDFSTESISSLGNLPDESAKMTSFENIVGGYGYFCGGINEDDNPATIFASALRLDFPNDTVTNVGNFPDPGGPGSFYDGSAVSSQTSGYIFGGRTPGSVEQESWMRKLDFDTETRYAKENTFRTDPAALQYIGEGTTSVGGFKVRGNNYGNRGYFVLGERYPSLSYPNNDRFDINTSTWTLLPVGSSETCPSPSQGFSTNDNAYFMGMNGGNKIRKLDFYTESTNFLVSRIPISPGTGDTFSVSDVTMPHSKRSSTTFQNAHYGYSVGGYPTATNHKVDRFEFANETYSSRSDTNSVGLNYPSPSLVRYSSGGSGHGNYGYIHSQGPASATESFFMRLDFSSENWTATNAPTNYNFISSNVAISPLYGYIEQSQNPPSNDLYKFDPVTEFHSKPGLQISSIANGYQGVFANSFEGYFGGTTQSWQDDTKVARLDFSTETSTTSTNHPVLGRKDFSSVGNSMNYRS